MKDKELVINTDGGSRGNPGPAACAFAATINGKSVGEGSLFLGTQTNNTAEYEGVILALKWLGDYLKKINVTHTTFILDSELVVRQLTGVYKIKNQNLLVKSLQIERMIGELKTPVIFENVPREKNKTPDKLLNEELDKNFSG